MRVRSIFFLLVSFTTIGLLLVSSLVVVQPGEQVVVRRLGRLRPSPWSAGLHWKLPLGLDRIDRIRVSEIRPLRVGLTDVPTFEQEPGLGEFLTGDLNLVRLELALQYRVDRPTLYVTTVSEPELILERLATSTLNRALAHRDIDAILREDRLAIATEIQDRLQRQIDVLNLGLTLVDTRVVDARPPNEVAAEFADAQAAQSYRAQRDREAQREATTLLADARARATTATDQAQADATQTLELAQSEADRFRALLAEARRAPRLTLTRLHLSTLRTLLPRVRRSLVLPGDQPLDLSLFHGQSPRDESRNTEQVDSIPPVK